jgi:hypothetical protein
VVHVAAQRAPLRARSGARGAVNGVFELPLESAMKHVEYWRWRYRDSESGRMCRTMYALSEAEAARLPQAERIPGTMILREVDEADFADTVPHVGFRPMD